MAGKPISILSNFFKFDVKTNDTEIQKYSLSYTPNIPESQGKLRERVARKANAEICSAIGKWVFANTAIYAVGSSSATSEQSFTAVFDAVEYTLTMIPVGTIDSPLEVRAFYNKFFNSVQGKLNLVMIGRKFFNPERSISLQKHKLTIWPGYASAIGSFEAGCLINIDISHRCLRTDTVYDQLEELQRKGGDYRLAFSKLIIGATVLTLYNKKSYHIDDIAWDMTPQSSFESRGSSQTFCEYYSTRWKQNIRNPNQPMLESMVKDVKCLLCLSYTSDAADE